MLRRFELHQPDSIAAASALLGQYGDEARAKLDQAGVLAAEAAEAVSDLHGTAEYKRHLVGVLLRRAFEAASGGETDLSTCLDNCLGSPYADGQPGDR